MEGMKTVALRSDCFKEFETVLLAFLIVAVIVGTVLLAFFDAPNALPPHRERW